MDVNNDWQFLSASAIDRRHHGDYSGAISDLIKAISIANTLPLFADNTATMLNYLAGIYFECGAILEAESAIIDAIRISKLSSPGLLADSLMVLAEVQRRKGENLTAVVTAEEAQLIYQQQRHSHGERQAVRLIEAIKKHSDFSHDSGSDN